MNDPLYRPYWPYVRRVEPRMGLRLVVLPSGEPIDLETARTHLRLDTTGSPPTHPDDSLITGIYLPAAREACEQYLGASLAPQFWELTLGPKNSFDWCDTLWLPSGMPVSVDLPMGPVLGVESVTYTSGAASADFTDYDSDTYTDRIRISDGASWPTTDNVPVPIVIRYQAGYSLPDGSPQDYPLPASLRAAILLALSNIYDNCTAGTICDIGSLPAAVKYLLDPYKRRMGFA